jgi:hypothetical protein
MFWAILLFALSAPVAIGQGETNVNIYHDFSLPIDLRSVRIMADLDISYAIGSTLVTHGNDGQLSSSVASRWSADSEKGQIDFYLNEGAKWADGSALTAAAVLDSFADTKKNFAATIPSLFESYVKLEAVGDNRVRFTLKPGITIQKFLEKLTEPMHGLVKIVNGKASTTITSGAYFVETATDSEVILRANKYWFNYSKEIIDRVHLRRPAKSITASTLTEDAWPDFISSPIVLLKNDLLKLPPKASIWRRTNDRLLSLSHAGKDLSATRLLFGYLKAHAPLKKFSELIDGGTFATQIYASGLILHSEKEPGDHSVPKADLVKAWPSGVVSIAYDPKRLPPPLVSILKTDICAALLPLRCEFHAVDVKDLAKIRRSNEYNIYVGSVGVDSINLDGGLSYYFELNPSMIPSDSSAKGNFIARLKAARMSPGDHVELFREILFDAVEGNYVLPLAHYSTTLIGRSKIDLSQAPAVFETVPFHLIRIRK